jgi:hypothetical protein
MQNLKLTQKLITTFRGICMATVIRKHQNQSFLAWLKYNLGVDSYKMTLALLGLLVLSWTLASI